MPAVLLVLVGALAGFLVHNRYPARLFMGDAGSNFLGLPARGADGGGDVHPTTGRIRRYSVLAPLLVMAVPLYDTTSVILIRLREGRSPFQGDRRHFSHRLVERGLTPPQAVRTIDLVTLAGGLGALLLHRLDAAGAVRGRRPDGLPARGGGHPGSLGDPTGARHMARREREIPGPAERSEAATAADAGRPPAAGRLIATARRRRRAAWLGERLRRVALGLTAALVTARAYWPSEPDRRTTPAAGWSGSLAAPGRRRAGARLGAGRRDGSGSAGRGPTRR